MYNPKKIWLLYAKKLYELFRNNLEEIPVLLKNHLAEVIDELKLNLDKEQKDRLFDIAMAFFQTEYLEAYRLASKGKEPDTKLSALQSCIVVEETTGYPVTELFKDMKQEIINDKEKPEEEVVDILIKRYGAYPAQAILKINLKETIIPENHLPDFCLAKSIKDIVDKNIKSNEA
ncbi:MAG: hypothetical protein OEZ20_07685 [candidate division WOR-3 bacterium]|nr:hypothetical protein [candidate division WOR-3 bacterium]